MLLFPEPNLETLTKIIFFQTDDQSTNMSALVVGNPRLPACVTEQWGWNDIPHAEQEAEMVGEMLQTKALIGSQASKEAVLCQIGDAECVHLATHVSWKLSAIVLAPGEAVESQQPSARCFTNTPEHASQHEEDGSEVGTLNL